ncbi:hypothetical protein TB1_000838 [Malus domestica]
MHRREEKNPETTAVAGPKIIRSLNSEGVKGIVNSSSSGSGQSVKETFHCPWGEVELERAAKWPHNYVKVLEILGYHGVGILDLCVMEENPRRKRKQETMPCKTLNKNCLQPLNLYAIEIISYI